MERAEFAAGSIDVRGSRAVHRFLSFLGAFFLGIGPGAAEEPEDEKWWNREERHTAFDAPPVRSGRQAELFDETGHAAFTPAEPEAVRPPEPAPVPAPAPARTVVSVEAGRRRRSKVIATHRAAPATRVSSVTATAKAARGAVARHLLMSQSISSGQEESRWFSVPQRVLLPRYQLFEGAQDAVREDEGGLRIGPRSMRTQRGQVWFV